MTPRQKWAVLNKIETLKDYGVSISESEMRTFSKGRAFLFQIRKKQRAERRMCRDMAKFGKNAAATMNCAMLECIVSRTPQ